MKRHIVLRQPQPSLPRHPLLSRDSPSTSAKFAEVAGGTAAECAAICCCCPCGIVNLLVVAVIKLPAGLCRRAIVASWRKKRAKKLLPKNFTDDMDTMQIFPPDSLGWWTPEKSPSTVVSDMEREMWEKFYSAGFWRNPSGRERVEAGSGEKLYD